MYSAFVTFWHTSNFPCVCRYVHTQGQKNSLVSVDNKWNRYTEHKMIFSSNLNTTEIPSIWHWRYSHRCLTAQTIQERGWWQFRTVWHRFHRAVYKNVLPWFECSMIWLWKFPLVCLVNSSNCSPSVPLLLQGMCFQSLHFCPPYWFPSHSVLKTPHWNWYLLLLFWKSYWSKFPLHLVTWLLLDSDLLSPHFWWLFYKDEIWPHPCSKSFYIERHSQSVHSNVSQHFILWQNSVLDFSASLCSICDDIPVMVLTVQRE